MSLDAGCADKNAEGIILLTKGVCCHGLTGMQQARRFHNNSSFLLTKWNLSRPFTRQAILIWLCYKQSVRQVCIKDALGIFLPK